MEVQSTWTAPDGSPWLLETVWANVGGRSRPVGVTLRGYDERSGRGHPLADRAELGALTAKTLRALTMADIEAQRPVIAPGSPITIDVLTALIAYEELHDVVRSPRDVALRIVAKVYDEAWQEGRSPTKAVADLLGISQAAAAKRVARARDKGYLPPTGRGRASGNKEND